MLEYARVYIYSILYSKVKCILQSSKVCDHPHTNITTSLSIALQFNRSYSSQRVTASNSDAVGNLGWLHEGVWHIQLLVSLGDVFCHFVQRPQEPLPHSLSPFLCEPLSRKIPKEYLKNLRCKK